MKMLEKIFLPDKILDSLNIGVCFDEGKHPVNSMSASSMPSSEVMYTVIIFHHAHFSC